FVRADVVLDRHEAECGEENSVGNDEDERRNEESSEISGASGGLWCLALRRMIIPMSFARPDATMNNNPSGEEQCANKRFQPIEHQHGAGGPFANEPTQRRHGVQPKGGK